MEYAKDLVWPLWELGDEIHRARIDFAMGSRTEGLKIFFILPQGIRREAGISQ